MNQSAIKIDDQILIQIQLCLQTFLVPSSLGSVSVFSVNPGVSYEYSRIFYDFFKPNIFQIFFFVLKNMVLGHLPPAPLVL